MNSSSVTKEPRIKMPNDIFEAVALRDEDAFKNFVATIRVPLKSLKNSEKQTVAHVAAQAGQLKALKYVLQRDSSVLKLVDHFGNNVLFWAAHVGDLKMFEYLVDSYNLDVSERVRRNLGNCAVHIAAEHGHVNILKYCLEKKHADVNIQNDAGEPPIFLAVEKDQVDAFKYLFDERDANITMTDDNNDNILYVCAKMGDEVTAKYILDDRKIEFDIDHRNAQGCTVTFVAAKYGNLEFVKYLVEEKHANISTADEKGTTPLHEAADLGHYEVVNYLVEKGADLDARGGIGNKTALQMAKDKDIKRLLKDSARKRTARSVPELLPPSASSCLQTRENCVESRESKTSDRTIFPEFGAWLAMAIVYANFFTKSRQKRQLDSPVVSPPAILERRMDPLAVEAAVSLFDSSHNQE